MALTEFLRRLVPQFTRDHRIRRGIGSSRRSQRGPTAPRLESLEDRTLLAAVAVDDSYTIDEGTSLRTGGFVAADRLVTEYDASALVGLSNGAAVSVWNDISGNGNTANAVQPGTFVANGMGGRPAVDFDLYDNYLSSQSVGATYGIQGDASWTMVWVANVPFTAPGTRSIGALGTGGDVRASAIVELENTRLDVAGGWGHDVILNPSNSFSQFVGEDVILTFRHDGNTGQSMLDTTSIFVNGFAPGEGPLAGYSLAGTGQGATLPYQIADRQFTLGGGSVSVTPGFDGLLSEVHLYNDSLSDEDLQHLEYSLGQKYGIAGGFQAPSVVGLLDNDAPDAGPLSAFLVNAPANGSLTLDPDGSVLYTPDAGFTGVDTFSYKVNDGTADSNVATVTVTVNDVPLNPVIADLLVAPDSILQGDSATLTANGVSDGDGDLSSVSFYFDSNDNGNLEPATDLLLGTDTDGSDGWQVVATTGAIPPGSATFLAQAVDGTALTSNVVSSSALITSRPVAVDDSYTIDEGTSLRTGGFVVADHLITEYDASAIVGIADGSPVAVWDDVSGKGNTGNAAQPGTFVGTGVGGRPSVGFGSNQQYQSTKNIGSNFGIQGDASWTMVWVANVANPASGYRWIGGIGSGGGHRTAAGVEIDNNRLDVAGGFANDVVLGPNDSFSQFIGEDVILTFRHDGNTGQSMLDTTSLFVNGFAPGEGPLAGNSLVATGSAGTGPYQIADGPIYVGGTEGLIAEVQIYDSALTDSDLQHLEYVLGRKYGISGGFVAPSVVGLLDNDTDASSDPLSALLVSGPTNGTLTLDLDGSVLYTPNVGFTGVDTFSYKVNDGTADSNVATVSINVNAQPANPVIASLTATPDPVLQSADLTLTANGVTDPNVNVAAVHFYRDVDNDGLLDTGIDELFGSDADGTDGWGVTAPAVFAVGTHTFLSQVEDTINNLSNVVATTVAVTPSVYWDGGGNDFQWTNPLNWNGDVLPGAGDDVIINVGEDITVQATGNASIRSLQSSEALDISGGSLTVTESSQVNSLSTVTGGTLTATGANASLLFSGGAAINTSNLFASGGGALIFGAGSSYSTNSSIHRTIQADGQGSFIDLSSLTSFVGTTGTQGHTVFYTTLNAYNGGLIDLSEATSVENQTYLRATGQDGAGTPSRIDLASLTDIAGTGRGSVLYATGPGVIDAPVVSSITKAGLVASAGATLDLSTATTYDGGLSASNTLRATGEGSVLDLSGITSFAGVLGTQGHTVFYTTVDAADGGLVDLSATTTVTNQTYISVSGQDGSGTASRIDLTALTDLAGAGRGSVVSVSSAGVVHAPAIATITKSGLLANDGATLDLSTATTYDGGNGAANTLRADGSGSLLDLSGLVAFAGATGSQGHTVFFSTVQALNGGHVDMQALLTSTGQVNYSASGADGTGQPSVLDLRSLTEVTGNSRNSLTASDLGLLDLASLNVLRGTSLYASVGGYLDVSTVTEYHGHTASSSTIQSDGLNSVVDLSGLQVLEGNAGNQGHSVWYLTINAQNLGHIALGTGTNDVSRRVSMIAQSGSISAGELHVFPGTTFAATGTLDADLTNETNMRLGASNGNAVGALLVNGDFQQTAGGTLQMKLGGLTAGTEFDQLNTTGTTTFAGTLNVSLVNGFSPADGDAFEVLTFGSRVDDFDTKNGLDLPGNQILYPNYGPNNMVLGAIGDDPPVVASLSAGPDPVLQSADLTLTANGVDDPNVNVAVVQFYRDVDGNGLLDTGVDELFGSDTDGTDGWSVTLPAVLATGTHTFLAQAEDTTDNISSAVSTTVEVLPSVYWDGGGGDLQWTNPLNWSGDVVPGASDTVVINVVDDITVEVNGNATVASVLSGESLHIVSGTLSSSADSTISAPFNMNPGATLTVSGGEFVTEAAVSVNGANLSATTGGRISLPGLLTYAADANALITATGAGSTVDLSGVQGVLGPVNQSQALTISTAVGGLVDISNAVSLSDRVQIESVGAGSIVDLASATSLSTDGVLLTSDSAFEMRLSAENGGQIHTPGVQSIGAVSLHAAGGSVLDLSNATSYVAGARTRAVILASDTGSSIDLSGVTTFTGTTGDWFGPAFVDVIAESGGTIDLSAATNINSQVSLIARDAGSLVDLQNAVSITGGTVLAGRNFPYMLRLVAEDGGVVSTPNVQTLVATSLYASGGSDILMPTATSFDGADRTRSTILASGPNSHIDLSGITTFTGTTGDWFGAAFVDVIAESGGTIDLSAATNINSQVSLIARDAGSLVDLQNTVSITGGTVLAGRNFPYMLRLVAEDGGVVSTPNVQTLVATSLYASGGSDILMPTATSFDGADRTRSTILASGPNSNIDLSGITTFTGTTGDWFGAAFVDVIAESGGIIDLSAATNINSQVSLIARDAGSLVDLQNTVSITGGTVLAGRNFPYMLRLVAEDGGVVSTPNVQTLVATSLYASGGSDILMPTATSFDGADRTRSTILASGTGSTIDLSGLSTYAGGQGSWFGEVRNVIHSSAGATVNMSGVSSLNGQIDLISDSGALMQLGAGPTLVNGSSSLTAVDGTVTVSELRVTQNGELNAAGNISGSVVNQGSVAVGTQASSLSISGRFDQTVDGQLNLQLGGSSSAAYDRISVDGQATLDGTLNISLINGFTPASGDSFQILQFDSRVCDFLTKNGLDLGGGLYLAAAFDLTSMTLNTGTTPDSGQQCQTIPVLTNVDVGPDPAKAADVLSITFEVDVALLNTPDVTVNGNAATLSAQNGSLYTFTYTVAGTENEGLVDVVMVATSQDGGVATETVSTELDFTDPVVSAITPNQTPADVGTILTVTFNSSEALSNSTEVLIGGQPATRNNVAGYSYSRLLTGDEGLGQVTIEVAAVDLAGNTSTSTGQVLIVSGGFDVNVTGIDVTNDHPTVGETVTITADVHNSGLYDVSNVPVRLSIIEPDGNETFLADTTVPVIAAGGFGTISVNVDLTTSGVHVLKLHVDPDNLIPEITELDNIATRSLIVDSTVTTAIGVTGALSHVSIAPARELSLTGTASWLANLNPAGALAGGLVTLSVPGTLISATAYSNSNGDFSLVFGSPVSPGDYVANVTVSDVTTDALLVLPFTVTAPAGGVDFSTNNNLVGVSDATPVAGTAVTLSARVYNVGGDDFGGATNVRFYDGGTLISTQSITGLASGASTVVSFTHTFNTPGTHVVTAIVDEDNLTVENNEANNTGTVTVNVLDTISDLSPIDILFSNATPATSDTITLTAQVRNYGGTAAASVVVRFFDDGTPLGAAVIPVIAADGGTEFISIQATLSTAGQRSISVVVDPDNGIPETNEDNNIRVETLTVHDPAPDLQASSIALSNNAPLPNQTFDVSMTVSNTGELAADAFDAEFRKDGVTFGTVRVPGLAAGGTTVVSLPTSFSAVGGHTVSIVLDAAAEITELSETNNSAFRSLQVLATRLSDLRITGSEITLSDDNPATGETVTVTVPIHNLGQATATAVTAQLRIDGNIVGSAASTPADIAAGAFASWTFDFVAPAGDGFHLLEIVVDEANQIGESDENNNRDFLQFLVGDHPDLVPSGITFSNGSPAEGDVVTISVTVSNDGDAAVGEFLVRILDGSQQIGQVTVAGLAIGASEIVSVPFDTTGRNGLRLIQVIADPGNLVTEVNEGNNLINANLTVASADAIAPVTVATPSVAANAAGWNNTDVDVVLTATDNAGGSGVGYLRYSVNGEDFQTTFEDTQTLSFTSEGIYSIRVQAVDNSQNEEPLQTFLVRIDKTAPVVVHSGPFTVAEGGTIVLDGTGSTDGLSGLAQIAWAMDGDNVYDDGDIVTYVAPDGPLTRPVALRVTDLAGNEAVAATQIDVTNVAPTADAGGNRSVSEGGTVALDATGSSDPGSDIATYAWDLDGDGVFGETGAAAALGDEVGQNPVFDAGALDGPVSRTVTLRVTDSYGAVDEETVTVAVTNVVPVFEAGPNDNLVPADNGVFTRTNILFTDPGLADGHTVTVNFGDNTGDQIFTLVTGTRAFDLGHTYVAEGQFTVNVAVKDDDGDEATDSFMVDVVLNTAPEAPTDSDPAANEVPEAAATGTAVGVTAGAFDADDDTLAYSLDGSAGGRFRIDASSGVVTVDDGSLLDGPDEHVITVRATDPTGEFSTADFTIAVLNVAPTVAAIFADVIVDEGTTAETSGVFGDIGADTVAITASIGTVTQNDATGTWSWSWDTSDGPDDSQTVTITATDSDGATSTATFDLTVQNVAPTVTTGAVPAHAVQWKVSDGGNGHFYWLTDAQNTWYDAENEAVALGAHLSAVASEAENAFLTATFLTGGQRYWIGFTDADDQGTTEGNFVWSSGEPVSYTNWAPGEPNNQINEDWTLLQSGGLWNDGRFNSVTRERGIVEFVPGGGTGVSEVVVSEGQVATNVGNWSDPGTDVVSLSASVGNVIKNVDGTWSWSWDTSDGPDDSQTVTITATDSDGAVTSTTFDLTVTNEAPTVAANNATITVAEGSTAGNSGVFGDVGADTVVVTASIGTVTQDDVAGTWSWSWDTSDGPDNSQTVTITATDSDGAATSTTFALTVTNEAPTVAANNATITVAEGSTAGNSGVFGDVGADTVVVTASIGTVTQNDASDTWAWSWDTSDGPDNSQTVTITATDSDGAVSTTTFGLTVNNLAPVLSGATFELLENSVNGTPVGTMTATDAGDDTIHYSIAGGTGATAFGIDPLSGVITVVDQSQLDFETTQSFTLEIAATDEDGGTDSAMVLINLQNQATISGVVYVDADQDGQFDADEMGVNDVVVELLNAAGDVLFSTVTQDGGLYFFEDMDAGTYRIRESQPSGVTDGPEQLGSIGGTVVGDDLMELSVSDLDASDYNFAEYGQQLSSGDTAGIGFWQNKHGQALIEAGGTALAGWLTDNFGNIFGAEFVGASGADVASFYKNQLFKQKGKKSAGPAKVDAQFMAVAFATFFTSQNLAGTIATGYGFNVSDTGIGTHVFNVGNSGAAFGVDDDTDLTIMQLLLATNQLTDVPDNYAGFASIYDQNGDGIIDSYEAFLRTLANDVFGAIND